MLGRFSTLANAVGDAEAPVGSPGEGEAREVIAGGLNRRDPLEVAHRVLGHGPRPSEDTDEEGLAPHGQDVVNIDPDPRHEDLVVKLRKVLLLGSAHEGPNEHPVGGGPGPRTSPSSTCMP